ncbi:MFS transporter [Actinocatenispora comari]|uniref:MFS transporter n=1 Tax=Actinocatenispora comari TaxID=2807577 RepID=UPI001A91EAAB|nr:MFS transporter [Actinocatenispora comari]
MKAVAVPRRYVAVIALGTLLNPLNSSMIAVALVSLQHAFGVGFGTASWLVSGFYLAACVGQPLMGRLADRFGPRRVYCVGLAVVCAASALAPFAPGFGLVLACRVLQAIGTSAAFPAGLALIRRAAGTGRPPAGALGTIAVANSASAGFGPVLGGFLVAFAGWQGIFLVNVPLTLVTLILAFRVLPPDEPAGAARTGLVRLIDPLGILLFSGTLVGLLGFLLALPHHPLWILLPLVAVCAAGMIWWELRAPTPFLDVRGFARSPALTGVLGQQAAIQLVFYGVFYGLPMWLEESRHYSTEQAGLLMLPIAALGVVVTPVAARLVGRFGPRLPLLLGSIGLLAGSLLVFTLHDATPAIGILGVAAVLGLPNGLNNMGLQAALYSAAPPDGTGMAAGLFQTARYVGAILSTALIGLVLEPPSASGLHRIAVVMSVFAALLVVAAIATRRRSGTVRQH